MRLCSTTSFSSASVKYSPLYPALALSPAGFTQPVTSMPKSVLYTECAGPEPSLANARNNPFFCHNTLSLRNERLSSSTTPAVFNELIVHGRRGCAQTTPEGLGQEPVSCEHPGLGEPTRHRGVRWRLLVDAER